MERFTKIGTEDNAHENGIWGLGAWSSGSQDAAGEFVTGGCDGKLKTWRFKTNTELATDAESDTEDAKNSGPFKQLATFSGHALPVINLALAGDGVTAASTSLDGTVKVWNLSMTDLEPKTIQRAGMTEGWDIAISKDGKVAVTGGANGAVQVIDTSLGQVDETFSIGQQQESKDSLRRENPMVMSVAMNEEENLIAAGGHDGSVTILDLESGKIVKGDMAKHGGPVRSISFMKNNSRLLLTASDDQLMNVYDLDSGHVAKTFRGHEGLVLSAAASDDSEFIVSGGSDRTVNIWDRRMAEILHSFKGHRDSVWGTTFTVKGAKTVAVSDDGSISAIDCSNAQKVAA